MENDFNCSKINEDDIMNKTMKIISLMIIALISISMGCVEESPTDSPTPIKEYSEFSTASAYVQWTLELDDSDTLTDYQKDKQMDDKIIGKYVQWECIVENVRPSSMSLHCNADDPPKSFRFRSVFLEKINDLNSDILVSINKGDTLKFEGKVRSSWLGALYLEDCTIFGVVP